MCYTVKVNEKVRHEFERWPEARRAALHYCRTQRRNIPIYRTYNGTLCARAEWCKPCNAAIVTREDAKK
jgi:hypothetical protein